MLQIICVFQFIIFKILDHQSPTIGFSQLPLVISVIIRAYAALVQFHSCYKYVLISVTYNESPTQYTMCTMDGLY